MADAAALHIDGVDALTGDPVQLWVHRGVFVDGPVADAVTVTGFVLPGLVDAHCHVGYAAAGAVDLTEAEEQARVDLAAGALALRDCGSPIDTRSLVGRDDLPVLIRAGRHIARPKRYIRDLGVDIEPEQLVDEVRTQLAYGGGWIKLVGDWIDRATGDLAPLWPADLLAEAIAVAHEHGARVTAHVFGEEALPDLLGAGVDCIEHGTGLTDDTIEQMVAGGVHLVPTMINIANFPAFADAAGRFPVYARHMRELYARSAAAFARAAEAGVEIHGGTDAGGFISHGLIVDEVQALDTLGRPRRELLAAVTAQARSWLGLPGLVPGAPADVLVFDGDPGEDLTELRRPRAVLRSGVVRAGTAMAAGRADRPDLAH